MVFISISLGKLLFFCGLGAYFLLPKTMRRGLFKGIFVGSAIFLKSGVKAALETVRSIFVYPILGPGKKKK